MPFGTIKFYGKIDTLQAKAIAELLPEDSVQDCPTEELFDAVTEGDEFSCDNQSGEFHHTEKYCVNSQIAFERRSESNGYEFDSEVVFFNPEIHEEPVREITTYNGFSLLMMDEIKEIKADVDFPEFQYVKLLTEG